MRSEVSLRSMEAQRLIREMPYWERRLWKRLNSYFSRKQLVFEPKAIVEGITLDFYCEAVKLMVELKGQQRFPLCLHTKPQLIENGYTVFAFKEPRCEVDVNNILARLAGEIPHLEKRFPQRQQ
jgi:very-short-patch-repair endonuclease